MGGADVHVASLLSWPEFGRVALLPQAVITASRNSGMRSPKPASLTLREGRLVTRVFSSQSWGYQYPGEDYQRMLSFVGEHLGTGNPTTPGGTGTHTLLRDVVGHHYGLPVGLRESLQAGMCGGRAETWAPGEYATLWRTDRIGAYLQEAGRPLPVGTARRLLPGDALPWDGEFFVKVRVRTPQHLGIDGPYPLRRGKSLSWPTTAGETVSWLWSCHVQDAMDRGCQVELLEGYGWDAVQPVLASWAEWARERIAAAGDYRGEVKRTLLSAIGVQAAGTERWTIRPESVIAPVPDEALLFYDGQPSAYVAQRLVRSSSAQLHWASCIYARQCSALYRLQRTLRERGHVLIRSNFDELVTREQPDEVPGWKQEPLHHAVVVAGTRRIRCEETVGEGHT